ncbi:anti-sigma factor family protein [Microlunatus parietis]|uniref:Anti-sigma factor RsiW n=1 Tax=Microlunatus parietis TaxID=682979 RepID=A0A7Y9LDJ6_9ACTN|nr:zf-HC2 domain-containing protein [Microlunatus parietis]NYE72943.1 anti-sigma factor RsiW [Microlunatus parietis]
MTAELTCRELVGLITDYLEGALPEPEVRRFDRHLTGCDGCTTYLEQFRRTIGLAGRLEPDDLDPAAESTLLSAFRNWKNDR